MTKASQKMTREAMAVALRTLADRIECGEIVATEVSASVPHKNEEVITIKLSFPDKGSKK